MSDQRFGIKRSDGAWYVGTFERKAIFTNNRARAGSYGSERPAARRALGLLKAERHGLTFEVLPVEEVRSGP